MAIRPEIKYPGKTIPASASYPDGEARNITTPGDGTGTPFDADDINDRWGFDQALLSDADISPSGNPDTALVSQKLQAVKKVIGTVANRSYKTLALCLAAAVTDGLRVDDDVDLDERVAGFGGGGRWKAITDPGHGNANGYNIVATSVANVSLQLHLNSIPYAQKSVFVDQWGAVGNGTIAGAGVDSYGAIQAAVNTLTTGGNVIYGQGGYRCSASIVPASDDVAALWHIGQHKLNTQIIPDHLTGPGIKLNRSNSGVKDLTIVGSTARYAGAAGTNYGLHIEGKDETTPGAADGKAIAALNVKNVKIFNQPSHGVMVVGNCQGSYFEMLETSGNKGHGAWFHEGTATGRGHAQSPGIVTIVNHWSINNDGHSLALGSPSDTVGEGPFRFTLINPEYGNTSPVVGVKFTTEDVWTRGTAINVIGSAVITDGINGGWYATGKNYQFIDTRWVGTAYAVKIDADHVLGASAGFNFNGLSVVNVTHDPSVIIADLATVTQVDVKTYVRDRITTLITPKALRSTSSYLGPDTATIIKTVADNAVSSTTLTADSELVFGIDTDEFLTFKLVARYNGDAAGDMKITVDGPAGSTVRFGPASTTFISTADAITLGGEAVGGSAYSLGCHPTTSRWVEFTGYISNPAAGSGGVTGDLAVKFAQQVSNATATSLLPGSSLTITRRNQI